MKVEKTLKEFKITLESRIQHASRIFIVPHKNMDFDAIGASVGMAEICRFFKKEYAIVTDDSIMDMNKGVRNIYDTVLKRYSVISSEEMTSYRTLEDLLITVDVGKKNLIPSAIVHQLDSFSHIVILDHHKEDEDSIVTGDKHVNTATSSTCEMITRLLKLFGIEIDSWLAKAFLAGIFVDTNKLKKNTDEKTLEVTARLIRRGATIQDVNDLFVEDFANDRKIQHLIDGTEFITHHIHSVALIYNRQDPDTWYAQSDLAQAADYLLPYKVDASFAFGFTGVDTVGISARTSGGMRIEEMMHLFGGGGNEHSAAAYLSNVSDLKAVREQLMKLICREDYYTVQSPTLTTDSVMVESSSENRPVVKKYSS